jgi:hypothetical protein
LKGEAGNLGIDAVRDAADALASAVRNGSTQACATLAQSLAEQCRLAVEVLAALSASTPLPEVLVSAPTPTRELQLDQVLPRLQQLAALLEVKSFGARAAVREAASLLEGSVYALEYSEIDHCVQALRYDNAMSKLQVLLEHLQQP